MARCNKNGFFINTQLLRFVFFVVIVHNLQNSRVVLHQTINIINRLSYIMEPKWLRLAILVSGFVLATKANEGNPPDLTPHDPGDNSNYPTRELCWERCFQVCKKSKGLDHLVELEVPFYLKFRVVLHNVMK